MDRKVYEQIKNDHKLPSPTGVALEILRLTAEEGTTLAELSAVLEVDAAIGSRLLRWVNSPASGLSGQVTSISRAIAMLGMRAVSNIALAFSLIDGCRSGPSTVFDYGRFWSDSLARAITARLLTQRLRFMAPDEAFTCGLLSQIGRLALATAFPQRYDQVIRRAEPGGTAELVEAEIGEFQTNHNALGAEMMADWNISAPLCEAVRHQLTPDDGGLRPGPAHDLARVLQLSGVTAAVLTGESRYSDALFSSAMLANRLGMAPDVHRELFDRVREEWRETGSILSVQTREVPPVAELYAAAARLRDWHETKTPSTTDTTQPPAISAP